MSEPGQPGQPLKHRTDEPQQNRESGSSHKAELESYAVSAFSACAAAISPSPTRRSSLAPDARLIKHRRGRQPMRSARDTMIPLRSAHVRYAPDVLVLADAAD